MRRAFRRLADYPSVADLFLTQGLVLGRIGTDSMAPVLEPGDLIRIDPALPPVGDLLVSERPQGWLCHRLVRSYFKEGSEWFVTRGDASGDDDPPVPRDRVIGRVVAIQKPARWERWLWKLRSAAGRRLRQSQLTLLTRLPKRPAEE